MKTINEIVSEFNQAHGWDITAARELAAALLTDCNDHELAEIVANYQDNSWTEQEIEIL